MNASRLRTGTVVNRSRPVVSQATPAGIAALVAVQLHHERSVLTTEAPRIEVQQHAVDAPTAHPACPNDGRDRPALRSSVSSRLTSAAQARSPAVVMR